MAISDVCRSDLWKARQNRNPMVHAVCVSQKPDAIFSGKGAFRLWANRLNETRCPCQRTCGRFWKTGSFPSRHRLGLQP